MKGMIKFTGIGVVVLGLIGLAVGIVFIVNGYSTQGLIADRLADEQITLGLPQQGEEGYVAGNVVDTAGEAKVASDTIREHRQDTYGTYADTSRGSVERDTFLDALTLENSLNLAQAGFGVSTMAIGSGVFMIVMGAALAATGTTLYYLSGRMS